MASETQKPKIYSVELTELFFFKAENGTFNAEAKLTIAIDTTHRRGQFDPQITVKLSVPIDPDCTAQDAENALLKRASDLLQVAAVDRPALIEHHQRTREHRAQNRLQHYA